ncbi:MAG: PrpR N-terminal domain-containing protein [Lachnospiraceae bacterium]|nr:PrpR N-terminal domain-containing protein [Lachnospiraceae bacterium]
MSRIRVLGIAPYDGMQILMQKTALGFPQIELKAMVGDLEKGVEVAQDNFHADYDVIISRGGTAKLLRSEVDLPVVEIPITEYDILRALHLVENVSDKFAIVGFPNVTENASHLSELLSVTAELFTIDHAAMAEQAVHDAWQKGYRTVLCDAVASIAAKRLGMNAILITSGKESIHKAFSDAILLCNGLTTLQAENHFLREVISGQSNETVVFDDSQNLYFSTVDVENRQAIITMLKHELENYTEEGPIRMIKSLDGTMYSIKAQHFTSGSKTYTTFYFSRSKAPFSSARSGIHYYTHQQAQEVFYNSFYSSAGDIANLEDNIKRISQSDRPVMLIGEEGTGKESVATMIYSRSTMRSHPFISINCALLNDKSWEHLQSSHNSPFAESKVTIYLSQIDALSQEKLRQLLAVLIDMDVCTRNRVIFSCTRDAGDSTQDKGSILADKLCCLNMHLPPLRSQKERIPALINLFLSQFGITQVSDVIGMNDEAVKLMQNFPWPHNLSQFKRVLQELTTTSASALISAEDVKRVLDLESGSPVAEGLRSQPERFDLNRTLEEMTKELVFRVLNECDGNQSVAAKRLGISRTTLWRYYKSNS